MLLFIFLHKYSYAYAWFTIIFTHYIFYVATPLRFLSLLFFLYDCVVAIDRPYIFIIFSPLCLAYAFILLLKVAIGIMRWSDIYWLLYAVGVRIIYFHQAVRSSGGCFIYLFWYFIDSYSIQPRRRRILYLKHLVELRK